MSAWNDPGIVDPNFRSHGMYLLRRDKEKKNKQHWREKYGLAMPDASRALSKVPTTSTSNNDQKKIQMRALYQNNATVTIYSETDKKATRSTNRSFRAGQVIIKDRKVKMLRTGKIKNVEKRANHKLKLQHGGKGYLLVDGTVVLEKQRGRTWVFWDKYAREDAGEVLAEKGITPEVLKLEEIEKKLAGLPFSQGMRVEVRQPDGSKKAGQVVHIHIDHNWGKFNCQYEDGSYGALIDNANIVIDRAWSSQGNWDFMIDGNDAMKAQREFETKVINLYQKKIEDPVIKKAMEEEEKQRSLIIVDNEHEDEEQDVEYGTMRVRKKLREMRERYMDDAPDKGDVPEERKKEVILTSGDLNELNLLKKGQYIHRGAKPVAPRLSKYAWVPASCKIAPKCRDGDDCKNPECLFRHPDGREKVVRKMMEEAHRKALEKKNDPFGLKRRKAELEQVKSIESSKNSAQVDNSAGARYLSLLKQASSTKALPAPHMRKKEGKRTLSAVELMNTCWLFRTSGTCKFGVNCPWLHKIPKGMRPAPPADLSLMQYDQKSHIW